MLSAGELKIIFAASIFLTTLLAGWYPFQKRRKVADHLEFPIGETLATGVFLGAALLHMLPEASNLFRQAGSDYPWASIITGAVFLFFLWFEHLGTELYHHKANNHPAFALLAWSMLSIHSIMLGAALGFNQQDSVVFVLFLAIITHKWAESFAIAIQLTKSSLSTKASLGFFALFTLMTPLGIYLGWKSGQHTISHSNFAPILISASAGTFLYLGTLHGLDRCVMVQRCCNLRDYSFVIIGFLLMALVAAYV